MQVNDGNLKQEIRFYMQHHWQRLMAGPLTMQRVHRMLICDNVCPMDMSKEQLFDLMDDIVGGQQSMSIHRYLLSQCRS